MRSKKNIIILLVLVCISCFHVSAQLPSVVVKDLEGNKLNVSSLSKKNKPLVVSFFATWCKPCLRELNAIAQVYEDWQEETGMELVAVSVDEGANSFKVKPLVLSNDWDYTVLLDSNKDFMRAMNVTMLPTVFVLNKKGEIVYRHTGYSPGGENEIIKQLRKCK